MPLTARPCSLPLTACLQGAAQKCEMCEKKKKVLPSAALAAIAGSTPAAAAAAEHLRDVASTALAAADAPAEGAAAAAAGVAGRQKQRKMSDGGAAGKRRRMETPASAAAARAPSPVVPASGTLHGWQCAGGGSSTAWVLLGSSLSTAGKQQLARLAEAAGARVVREWSRAVTHVVCGTTDGSARCACAVRGVGQGQCRAEEGAAQRWGQGGCLVVCLPIFPGPPLPLPGPQPSPALVRLTLRAFLGRSCAPSCRRTYKYLQGVAHANWVVGEEWLRACLEAQAAVPEEGFQVRPGGASWAQMAVEGCALARPLLWCALPPHELMQLAASSLRPPSPPL